MTWAVMGNIFFALSVALNVFVVWYCVRLLRELLDISGSLEGLFSEISLFSRHLENVYELETFYGDETLENLLSHARALVGEFERYEVLFSLREAPPLEEENFDDPATTPPQTKI